MASAVLAAVAGGLKGLGQGLTAEHERRETTRIRREEMREGARLRHAYQMKYLEGQQKGQKEIAQIGATATADAAQLRSADSRYGVDVRAEVKREDMAQSKETTEKEALDERFKFLATEYDPDTEEEVIDKDLYQGLRAGHKKFGKMPSLQEVRIWAASHPSASQRQWPGDMKRSWSDIEQSARKLNPDLEGEDLRQAMIAMRDRASSLGVKVPSGEPPASTQGTATGGEAGTANEAPRKRSQPSKALPGEMPAGEYLAPGEDPGELDWLIRRHRHRKQLEQEASGGQ